jgi:alkylation response protein AidB-like acyl-CoA dehydrogenase
MNFDLSDDQRMLKDSLNRLLTDNYQLDQRIAYMREEKGFSDVIWADFIELGLTMMPFTEAQGGLGLGSVEMMLVGECFGRALVVEPFLPSIVLAGTALANGGNTAADILADIIAGERFAALAIGADVRCVGGRLSGQASHVMGGNSAYYLIVPDGAGAFCLPVNAPGVTRRSYTIHGGGGAADVTFDGVDLSAAIRLSDGCVTRAVEAGIAFVAAEAAGAMQAILDITVDYLKTREQFGKPIGSFQVLQHRAAEMLVEVEQVKSAAIYAALMLEETETIERAKGLAAVKAVVGKSARFVAQSAVQLHGGIGVSEEHMVSHYFRRLTVIDMILGDTHAQVKALAELGGFTAP